MNFEYYDNFPPSKPRIGRDVMPVVITKRPLWRRVLFVPKLYREYRHRYAIPRWAAFRLALIVLR